MKRMVVASIGIVALALVGCEKQPAKPEVIAHRGFWNTEGAAKNSISALKNAVELGCYGSEFDVWVTADDVPVIFHDSRTASGIEIRRATYDSLMRGAEPLANGERIPTLAEYLAAWDHAPVKLILELKSHHDAAADDRAVAVVLESLRKFDVAPGEIEYISFSRHAVKAFVDRRCGSPVAYLGGDLSPGEARDSLGATGIDYQMQVLREHPEWIAEAHKLGMTVNVWTVVSPADMRYFMDAGVDYITTDAPGVLLKEL